MEHRRREILDQAAADLRFRAPAPQATTGRTASASMVADPAVPMSHSYRPPGSASPGQNANSRSPPQRPRASPRPALLSPRLPARAGQLPWPGYPQADQAIPDIFRPRMLPCPQQRPESNQQSLQASG
jgi:hypothetical protein